MGTLLTRGRRGAASGGSTPTAGLASADVQEDLLAELVGLLAGVLLEGQARPAPTADVPADIYS